MGAAVVRAYGLEDRTDVRLKRAIDQRYRAQIVAHWRSATLFPLGTMFYAVACRRRSWSSAPCSGRGGGSRSASVTAFIFLSDLFLHLFMDLPEIYSETQTAIAGWRKILTVLDLPVEIVEPANGVELPKGALAVRRSDVRYSYREGPRCCTAITVDVGAGRTSRSSARPGAGRRRSRSSSRAWPIPRRSDRRSTGSTSARSRRHRGGARSGWFPRTGSCSTSPFARTCAFGRPGATDRDVETAFEELGLGRVGGVASRGARHPRRRARRGALGRRTPARLARAGADRPARAADPRRGDERGGPGHRTPGHRSAPPALGRTYRDHDRPPAVDRRARGAGLVLRRGPPGRRGHARGVASRAAGSTRGCTRAGSATYATSTSARSDPDAG